MLLGIIGGAIKQNMLYSSFLIGISGSIVLYQCWRTHTVSWLTLIGVQILGAVLYLGHPLTRPIPELNQTICMTGTIKEKEVLPYSTRVTLADNYRENSKTHKVEKLPIKLISQSSKWEAYHIGDKVKVVGRVVALEGPYNPSDMDYKLYLQGKGIGAQMNPVAIERIGFETSLTMMIKEKVIEQIDAVFGQRDKGIVRAILLGDKSDLMESVKVQYNALGIGHILAVSGLHIGILYGVIWYLTAKLKFGYTMRQVVILVGLWSYCVMTGMSLSALRATGIMTFLIVGKILWEELDYWNAVGWLLLIMIFFNPYTVFQVGFQLSFGAYVLILEASEILKKFTVEERLSRTQLKVWTLILPTGLVSLGIAPILAYHFYEIPVIASINNLWIGVMMSSIVPLILVALLLSLWFFELASHLSGGICLVFDVINQLGEKLLQLPLATVVVGRPQIFTILIYYCLLVGGIARLKGYQIKQSQSIGIGLVGAVIIFLIESRQPYEMTFLYVGQGDSTIILTPQHHVIMIDAGKIGKGKVVERFLNYNGYDTIDLAIVTHADEDHIAGLIEMIVAGVEVGQVCMPYMPSSSRLANQLKAVCKEEDIPYSEPIKGSKAYVGDLVCDFLAPKEGYRNEELNALSAVICVDYKGMKTLFTGDLPMQQEFAFLSDIGDIDILQVGHHGSKTSTSEKLLAQTLPEYGMISCGKNNRYNHPDILVLERLEEAGVTCFETDEQGAISVRLVEHTLTIDTQLKN